MCDECSELAIIRPECGLPEFSIAECVGKKTHDHTMHVYCDIFWTQFSAINSNSKFGKFEV